MDLSIYNGPESEDVDIEYHLLTEDKLVQIRIIDCILCKSKMKLKHLIAVTRCEHIFHMDCLNNWLGQVK